MLFIRKITGGNMKILTALSLLILLNSSSFAYDRKLIINVKKVGNLLSRAESFGSTPDGAKCYVEVRRIEDGFYTLYTETESESIFIGLDIEAYGKIKSKWTKRSFSLQQKGLDGSQQLLMKEEFSTRRLSINAVDILKGNRRQIQCILPLK